MQAQFVYFVLPIILMVIGLSTLQYVLEEGQRNDWFQSALITGLTMGMGK